MIKRLAGPLGEFLPDFGSADIDAVVPVPLSITGLRNRCFNQSLLLAKTFSDKEDIPLS
ncbi:MAG: ComF family protein [Acidobacteriota bacterium]